LARIQQQGAKHKPAKSTHVKYHTPVAKQELAQGAAPLALWKERQLRDYTRANNLCYFCREKFDANHLQKCTKRAKPQVNAIVVNELDVDLNDDTLNQLAIEDALTTEMG
jgi:hypothetical protein